MLARIRNLFGRPREGRRPALSPGERAYAIGDIHGRIDLLDSLIDTIEEDDASRSQARTTMVFLGDLIDRGPDSAAVVARAREWSARRPVEFVKGNHEEMLIASLDDADILRGFLLYGGRQTLLSYDIDPHAVTNADFGQLQELMREAIPPDDIAFLDGFRQFVHNGDYLFVHAGIRPEIAIEDQLGEDCRWIREPFLSYNGDFGAFVIHGHTISEEPQIRGNRIGIDTGAYLYGTLTAIGIEGTDRWFIQARQDKGGTITTFAAAA
jgi:serine/threonine protein phosphatase 1